MRKILICLLALFLSFSTLPAYAEVSKNPYLDAAFSCLEEGNPFLKRYNEITDSDIEPILSTGMPYFFGGQSDMYLLKVRKLAEKSSYGAVGDRQIYGFDCVGFTRWVQRQAGDKPSPSLYDMINSWYKYRDYRMDHLKDMTDFSQIASELLPGDLFVGMIDGRHILMYIGTLTDYGYTAASAPELADYLHYPLFINCGNDPRYIERMQRYIDENSLNCDPNKGGVTISIIGPSIEDAPHVRHDGAKDYYYFDADGYSISVYDIHQCTSHVWWRTVESDKSR